jgi:thiamine phosphate synthase YjbQ (UPF0047 family)
VTLPLQTSFTLATRGAGLHEFTPEVARWVAGSGARTALLTLFVRHTCPCAAAGSSEEDCER